MKITNNLLFDRNDDRGDDKQKGLNFKLVELEMKRKEQRKKEFYMLKTRETAKSKLIIYILM